MRRISPGVLSVFLLAGLIISGGCASTKTSGRDSKESTRASRLYESAKSTTSKGADVAVKTTKKGAKAAKKGTKKAGKSIQKGYGAGKAKYREIKQVSDIPGDEEARLYGRKIAARVAGNFRDGIYDSPSLTKYVNLVGQLCAANANRHGTVILHRAGYPADGLISVFKRKSGEE